MPCEGCGLSEAAMQCPTCKKLDMPPSYFCSQACFKEHWADHKLKHTQSALPTIPTMTEAAMNAFNFTGSLRPGRITPRRAVPPHIPRPDYANRADGLSPAEEKDRGAKVRVYNLQSLHDDSKETADIQRVKKVCRLSREVLDIATAAVRPGVTTDEIDRIVHEATIERDMYPSPLNYYNFPKSVCTSVNEVICHGIPDSRELEEGDIVNIDVSSYLNGFHGDLNETVFVGKPDADSVRLVHAAYESLFAGIKVVKPEALYKHVGDAIEACAVQYGCSVVRAYTGHGVGHLFHTAPTVCHYANNKSLGMMRPGHVFTIEPMINLGTWQDVTWPDNWTSTTRDGRRSAQFEHTMVVTNDGAELFTDWTDGIPTYQKQLEGWNIPLPSPSNGVAH
ncbi:metallo- peptidase, Clan MG, Family M24 [Trypanosoma cruzi]|uniref:Methionine aminopeptidase n=2 Tax=Trypanosoma cruzi TaxID=5693 RepID=Q4DS97_TRYCC|nr:methionine aminopeptidase, putative [Trypanosoma cruzi]EAN95406.1 methionine aminopeptidase, putative [Trypanosoma cruzi]PWV17393.1 metallo- peptidase, Clan MG, Family M24 [Trypanosoma cruzi]RNC47605.1 putative methionine aminopeptidase, putative,metallo-peptidase, Clan MG, Family M24 [Trypanosoma cruzi]|eukprot:XP_817257.1 methionine aminopeptidase [Trypanosoma cruzi strain CL Brener]